MDNASDTSGMAQDAHKGQRREIFVCVLVHLGWTVAAAGCAMGTADLGSWRWLLPATLLLLGLLQALLAWLVQGGGGHGGGGHGGGAAPARARVDGFTTPQKSGATPGGKRDGPGLARRDVAGQLLRNLHVLTFAASVLDLPILLGGNSRRDHGYDLARDTKHRYKRLAIFVTRRLAPATCNPMPPGLQPHAAWAATPRHPGGNPKPACVCVCVCVQARPRRLCRRLSRRVVVCGARGLARLAAAAGQPRRLAPPLPPLPAGLPLPGGAGPLATAPAPQHP